MKASKQQSAVEWLVELLRKYGSPVPREFEEQAKAMEKEQIIEAHNNGKNILPPNENGQQYYTETYGE